MIYSKSYKLVELVLLFVLLPLSFLLDYDFKVKAGLVILGFIYILTILFKFTDASFKIKFIVSKHSYIIENKKNICFTDNGCLLYTSPSPRD